MVTLADGTRLRPNATWMDEEVILLQGIPPGEVKLRIDGTLGCIRLGDDRPWQDRERRRLELDLTVLPDGPNRFTIGTNDWKTLGKSDKW